MIDEGAFDGPFGASGLKSGTVCPTLLGTSGRMQLRDANIRAGR
jgi:hypothetical protein